MRDNRKSTDPGLSAAERKAQRSREAQEAIADLEKAQRAFHENRERLRAERMAREAAAGADALSGARASGRHTHRKRPIFYEGPKRVNIRRLENHWRNSRGFRCYAFGPAGSRSGLSRPSS